MKKKRYRAIRWDPQAAGYTKENNFDFDMEGYIQTIVWDDSKVYTFIHSMKYNVYDKNMYPGYKEYIDPDMNRVWIPIKMNDKEFFKMLLQYQRED